MHKKTQQSAFTIVAFLLALMVLSSNVPAAGAQAGSDPSVRVLTPQYQLDADGVSVPGYAWNDAPGAPRLPVYGTVVELPAGGDWQIAYDSAGSSILAERARVPAVPVPQLPQPTPENQAPDVDSLSPPTLIDQPDPAIYGADAFYPAAPVAAGDVQVQRGRRLLAVRIFPFQYNPVTGELRYHPDVTITVHVTPAAAGNEPPENALDRSGAAQAASPATPNALDASAGAVRIRTGAAGMYRLTYSDLLNAGVPVGTAGAVDPRSFQMSARGSTVQIQVTGEADGRFDNGDLVIFYAEAYTGRYMTQNVYWLTYGSTPAPADSRMSSRSSAPSKPPLITTIMQTVRARELAIAYYGNYPLPTDADHWFDSALYPTTSTPAVTRAYNVTLDDAITTGNVQVTGLFYGGMAQAANPDQSIALRLNTHPVATFKWDGQTGYTGTATAPASYLDGAPNQIVLEAALSQLSGVTGYFVYPDWVELRYPALADAEGDRIAVEGIDATTAAQVQVTGFTTSAVLVYDVRVPQRPVQITTAQSANTSAPYTVTYVDEWPAGSPAASYSLTTEAALLAPAAVELDTPSAWRSAQGYDYIAIVHRSLWDAVQPLLARRAAQGLRVAKVDVQDVYDEFSNGLMYPPAIRDFLSHAYHNWNGAGQPPQYVLLVGDGHYDFKLDSNTTLPNLIPPYLIDVDPFIGEVPADNRFVSVDGANDYLPDMAIGRIPARTAADVTNAVTKILAYEDTVQTPDGAWQSRVVMVADDYADPNGNFHAASDEVRTNWLAPQYTTQRIYYRMDTSLDTGDEMRTAIKAAFNNPPVLLQWVGHGSAVRWGTVSMFNINDPVALQANTRLPFTQSYSCNTGYFVNIAAGYQALGETLLLQAGRGSVADLSPSGQHTTSDGQLLNEAVVTAVFRDRVRRVGDAVDAAKLYYFANNHSFPDVIDSSILFGDPALSLRVPAGAPAAPVAAFARVGGAMKLTWPHQLDSASYEVWRGTTPFFDPNAGQGVKISTVTASFVGVGASYTAIDTGATPPPTVQIIGDPAVNYFWLIRSRNGDGVSTPSNRGGEFDFQLMPGS
jgi:hypothetical protein